MKTITIICAIPQERRPILRRLGPARKLRPDRAVIWSGTLPGQRIFLIESGIGMARAAAATAAAIAITSPDIVISTGFCGAVMPGLHLGDVVMADKIFAYSASTGMERPCLSAPLSPKHLDLNGIKDSIHRGAFITTETLVAKSDVSASLSEQMDNPVLEMESYAIIKVCNERNIPCIAIRAVSDTFDFDPQPCCSKIFDAEMQISMPKLLRSLWVNPALILKLLKLKTDTKTAGILLAQAVVETLKGLRENAPTSCG